VCWLPLLEEIPAHMKKEEVSVREHGKVYVKDFVKVFL